MTVGAKGYLCSCAGDGLRQARKCEDLQLGGLPAGDGRRQARPWVTNSLCKGKGDRDRHSRFPQGCVPLTCDLISAPAPPHFPPPNSEYLDALVSYLGGFYERTQPLAQLQRTLAKVRGRRGWGGVRGRVWGAQGRGEWVAGRAGHGGCFGRSAGSTCSAPWPRWVVVGHGQALDGVKEREDTGGQGLWSGAMEDAGPRAMT